MLSMPAGEQAKAGTANCSAGICVQLTATPATAAPGGWVSFATTATNNLNSYAYFTLSMHVPDQMTAVAGSYGTFTCYGKLPSGDCPAGALLSERLAGVDPGNTVSAVLSFRLDRGASAPANGTVIPAWVTVGDSNFGSASATAVVQVDSAGGLNLGTAADLSSVQAGQTLTYTLSFGNSGRTALASVSLRALVPANVSVLTTDGVVTSNRIDWDLETLPAGGHGQRQFTVQVDSSMPAGSLFVMQADLLDESGHLVSSESPVVTVSTGIAVNLQATPATVAP
jgi:uncharacterized repeat protein (TIGR01451 family)